MTAVAERVPQYIAHLVYLTAFMPKSGSSVIEYVTAVENTDDLISAQLRADPAVIGALRMDHRSEDPNYQANGRRALYADVSNEEYLTIANLLTPDVPLAPLTTAVVTTPQRWGSVPRHYIKCLQVQAVRPALQ